MAERFGYFNGIEYDEDFVALTNRTLVGTGVFYDQLAPSANGTMDVYIAEGSAMINGFLYNNSETMVIPISAADGSLDRKDSIFIRWDIAGRRINIVYSEGVASSNPEAPEIRRTDTFFDLKIAEIFVPAGSGAITMNNITDTRADDTVCGFVVGYDTADLQAVLDQLNSVANRDYIVEQGTSGDWYYRKWNSGVAECWCTTETKTNISVSTAWGGVYYGTPINDAYTYPFTFTENPTVSATPANTSGDFWLMGSTQYKGNTSRTPRYHPVRGNTGTASGGVYIYAIGKWK